jgi:hypothetical protein
MIPNTRALVAIASIRPPIKGNNSMAEILFREPNLADAASKRPMIAPAHHVAITPQPSPRSVGELVRKTGG